MSKILPNLSYPVWILAGGRLLSQIGNGFTLFYAPIFFVNQLGFSATSVGIALGSASVSGILGRFLGGSFSDSPFWGRKGTLLLSAAVSAVADIFLALTYNYPILLMGNLLMGLGIGIYWPATEAAVADLTTPEQRNEGFAITRLADSLGLGIGVALGGGLIALSGQFRALFVIDGISFVLFFLVIYVAIEETYQFTPQPQETKTNGWLVALKDSRLWVFMLVNILFTTYISQLQTTLPLYLTNFTATGNFGITTISGLFSLHIAFAALFQLPVISILNNFSRIHALMISLCIWGLSFILVWITGNIAHFAVICGLLALLSGAIATVSYTPYASALIVDLSPPSLRGVYFALNSQCWAIGYLIGPPLGGWVLDTSATYAHNFWLIAAASISVGIVILWYLEKVIKSSEV
jgi:MFS family permease